MTGGIADWVEELARFPMRAPANDDGLVLQQRRNDAMRGFERSLPPIYRLASVNSRLLPERVKQASISHDWPRDRAVFFGPSGRGKTRLAVAFLRTATAEHVRRTAFATDDVVDRIPTQYRFADARELGVGRLTSSADGLAAIQLAIRAELLLLDDLGSECAIPSNPLADIVAARHAAQRLTWITTELSAGQVATRYGGGAARRIFEGATLFAF